MSRARRFAVEGAVLPFVLRFSKDEWAVRRRNKCTQIMAFYVYMILCVDGNIYTAQADNLEARLAAHDDGGFRGSTFKRRPVRPIFQAAFATREEALEAEHQIKGWSRAKKLALVEGDWELIERLSLRRQAQHR